MDSLPDEEIEGIWFRTSRYINLDDIEPGSKREIAEQLDRKIRAVNKTAANPQARGDFLANKGLAERVVDIKNIFTSFFSGQVRQIKQKTRSGQTVTRHQYKGKTVKLGSGRFLKSGQFLRGRNESEAIEHLKEKRGA